MEGHPLTSTEPNEAADAMAHPGHMLVVDNEFEPAASNAVRGEAEPYAPVPSDASAEDRARHRENFSRAMHERAEVEGLEPIEKLVKRELSIYLASHYDARPFDEIASDVRAVLLSQMGLKQ